MNIFYVHKDPIVSAKMLIDKHVCKMIIESAQMLSTSHRMLDGEEYLQRNKNGNRNIKRWLLKDNLFETTLYKACHTGHPSTVWVMANVFHYNWLYNHMIALNDEFKLRYGHTDPTPAMPDECKIPGDVVGSYRKYYIEKKQSFASWKSPSTPPQWWVEGVANVG